MVPSQGYQVHARGFQAPRLAGVVGNVNPLMASPPPHAMPCAGGMSGHCPPAGAPAKSASRKLNDWRALWLSESHISPARRSKADG